jgi:Flp pilus assembly pilin Flp
MFGDCSMTDLSARWAAFMGDESGAAAAEYGMLLAALVVLVALAAATLGDSMSAVLHDAAGCVEDGCV